MKGLFKGFAASGIVLQQLVAFAVVRSMGPPAAAYAFSSYLFLLKPAVIEEGFGKQVAEWWESLGLSVAAVFFYLRVMAKPAPTPEVVERNSSGSPLLLNLGVCAQPSSQGPCKGIVQKACKGLWEVFTGHELPLPLEATVIRRATPLHQCSSMRGGSWR